MNVGKENNEGGRERKGKKIREKERRKVTLRNRKRK